MSRWILLSLSLCFAPTAFAEIPELSAATQASVADYRGVWESQLRAERQVQIQRLQEYAAAGVFPRNAEVVGFNHQFLDAAEHPCAVASLMWKSGNEALVRETARTHNDIVLSEVESGPLVEWVLTSGLTREEVAVIQVPGWEPDYVNIIPQPLPEDPRLVAERQRVIGHLNSAIAMLQADTEMSIATALDRLGDRVMTPPPAPFS